MGEDELATIEDCIRCAYVECLIDEDRERRLLAELARLRAVEAAAVEAVVVEELTRLRAEVERLRGLVGGPDRNPAPHTPLRAFVGILPEAGR